MGNAILESFKVHNFESLLQHYLNWKSLILLQRNQLVPDVRAPDISDKGIFQSCFLFDTKKVFLGTGDLIGNSESEDDKKGNDFDNFGKRVVLIG